MARNSKPAANWMQTNAIRNTRIHFLYVAAYILATIVFDSWNLYTYKAVSQLWTAAGLLLAAVAIIWFVSRMKFTNNFVYTSLVWILILADIAFASYNVYWQHGLASKSVMLFTVPIVTAATLYSRSTLLATTTLCAAAYSTVSVRYFFQNYGLSYRVELWGTIGLYSAIFFVLAGLLMVIILPRTERF